jgi:acyl-CoA thioesterase
MAELPSETNGFNPFGELIGLHFSEYGNGRCQCTLHISHAHLNPNGVVHGAVIYALADTSMGGALVTDLSKGQLCATIEIKISYYQAVSSGELVCDARVMHRGKRIAFMAADVSQDNTLVAQATGTFTISSPM